MIDVPDTLKNHNWMKAFKQRWKVKLDQLELWMVSYLVTIEDDLLSLDLPCSALWPERDRVLALALGLQRPAVRQLEQPCGVRPSHG